jgi:diaminohydroxyphosphoribosylaminopyrimidine deaminase / 5-amino-6-(5-phosphoribosylamino)uracil reductase
MIEKKRPYIILKWAQTANGFIAGAKNDPRWISNTVSRQLVHKWRSEEDSVLVGYRTALADNPKLNVRDWTGRDPLRLVIDRDLTLPHTLHLFDRKQKTIVYNNVRDEESENLSLVRLGTADFIGQIVSDLQDRKIQSLILEGGQATLSSFIGSGLWDEARVFESSAEFGSGLASPKFQGTLLSTAVLSGNTLRVFQNPSTRPAPVKF